MNTIKGVFHVVMRQGGSLLLLIVLLALSACRPAGEMPVERAQDPAAEGADSLPAGEPVTIGDPVEIASGFYEWYLAYNNPEEGRNALVDHAYRESEYLSTRLIGAVNADLERMRTEYGGAGADPFLMAQAIPQAVEIEHWETGADRACVIAHQLFGERIRDLTVDLTVEDGTWKIDQIRVGSPLTPEGVTELFLTDYLKQAQAALQEGTAGMLQSGTYRESELLSPAFVTAVDETVAGFDRGGYDPFLCAQDLPHALNIGEPVIEGDTATVMVGRYYAGTAQPTYMTVELVQVDGRWLIVGIRPLSESAAPQDGTPETVVEAFYAEWREAIASGGGPLQSGAYHESAYLTAAFAAQIDGIVAGFDRGGYDPFLCAQDVPAELAVDGTIYTDAGARVVMHSSFANHAFVVELEEAGENGWQIANVVCPGTPESNALVFYTWYLAYTRNCCVIGATDPGMQRSPLADGAYKEAPFIKPAFAAEVEAELLAMKAGGGGYDPILQAQAFPPNFSVEPGEEAGTVIVDMAFANPHTLAVQMEQVDGQWLVSGITRQVEPEATAPAAGIPDISGWTAVADVDKGFSFRIPPGWVAEEQNLQQPGIPDDWPVQSQYLVMPGAIAEELAARSGPPGGDEMVPVPPFVVSFLYGDQAAFDRAYVTAAFEDKVELNGNLLLAQRQEGEYSLPRYILQDSEDPLRWLIVEDVVNEFPGREVQAAEVWGILDGILASLSLDG